MITIDHAAEPVYEVYKSAFQKKMTQTKKFPKLYLSSDGILPMQSQKNDNTKDIQSNGHKHQHNFQFSIKPKVSQTSNLQAPTTGKKILDINKIIVDHKKPVSRISSKMFSHKSVLNRSTRNEELDNSAAYKHYYINKKNIGVKLLNTLEDHLSNSHDTVPDHENHGTEEFQDEKSPNKTAMELIIHFNNKFKEVNKDIWSSPHIRKKLDNHLDRLEDISNYLKMPLRDLLGKITESSIPKYSRFSNLTLEDKQVLDAVVNEYDEIYEEFFELYHKLGMEQNKCVSLANKHKIRLFADEKLKMKILEIAKTRKKPSFKVNKKECKKLLCKIREEGNGFRPHLNYENFKLKQRSESTLQSYHQDYNKYSILQIRDYKRKINRLTPNKSMLSNELTEENKLALRKMTNQSYNLFEKQNQPDLDLTEKKDLNDSNPIKHKMERNYTDSSICVDKIINNREYSRVKFKEKLINKTLSQNDQILEISRMKHSLPINTSVLSNSQDTSETKKPTSNNRNPTLKQTPVANELYIPNKKNFLITSGISSLKSETQLLEFSNRNTSFDYELRKNLNQKNYIDEKKDTTQDVKIQSILEQYESCNKNKDLIRKEILKKITFHKIQKIRTNTSLNKGRSTKLQQNLKVSILANVPTHNNK